jgi:hypothetical protein
MWNSVEQRSNTGAIRAWFTPARWGSEIMRRPSKTAHVQTLERGLAALEALCAMEDGLSLHELSQRLKSLVDFLQGCGVNRIVFRPGLPRI